jgi:molecular chaperone DnaK (HSP70)
VSVLQCGAEDRRRDPRRDRSHRSREAKTFNDMEAAAKAMREQDNRRDSIFQQSVEAQRHASDLLEKKFQEAVKKAKETPDTGKPIRDFDLD